MEGICPAPPKQANAGAWGRTTAGSGFVIGPLQSISDGTMGVSKQLKQATSNPGLSPRRHETKAEPYVVVHPDGSASICTEDEGSPGTEAGFSSWDNALLDNAGAGERPQPGGHVARNDKRQKALGSLAVPARTTASQWKREQLSQIWHTMSPRAMGPASCSEQNNGQPQKGPLHSSLVPRSTTSLFSSEAFSGPGKDKGSPGTALSASLAPGSCQPVLLVLPDGSIRMHTDSTPITAGELMREFPGCHVSPEHAQGMLEGFMPRSERLSPGNTYVLCRPEKKLLQAKSVDPTFLLGRGVEAKISPTGACPAFDVAGVSEFGSTGRPKAVAASGVPSEPMFFSQVLRAKPHAALGAVEGTPGAQVEGEHFSHVLRTAQSKLQAAGLAQYLQEKTREGERHHIAVGIRTGRRSFSKPRGHLKTNCKNQEWHPSSNQQVTAAHPPPSLTPLHRTVSVGITQDDITGSLWRTTSGGMPKVDEGLTWINVVPRSESTIQGQQVELKLHTLGQVDGRPATGSGAVAGSGAFLNTSLDHKSSGLGFSPEKAPGLSGRIQWAAKKLYKWGSLPAKS